MPPQSFRDHALKPGKALWKAFERGGLVLAARRGAGSPHVLAMRARVEPVCETRAVEGERVWSPG